MNLLNELNIHHRVKKRGSPHMLVGQELQEGPVSEVKKDPPECTLSITQSKQEVPPSMLLRW